MGLGEKNWAGFLASQSNRVIHNTQNRIKGEAQAHQALCSLIASLVLSSSSISECTSLLLTFTVLDLLSLPLIVMLDVAGSLDLLHVVCSYLIDVS